MSQAEGGDDPVENWFDLDEDQLARNVQERLNASNQEAEVDDKIEYITNPSEDERYLHQHRLNAAAQEPVPQSARIPTSELRQLTEQAPLEVFLYVFTKDEPDFFRQQIVSNDAMDRVYFYTRILNIVCELRVPGFHVDLIKRFVEDDELLEQMRAIVTKMCSKRYKSLWRTPAEKARLDSTIVDINRLFLQAYKLGILSPKATEVIQQLNNSIQKSEHQEVKQRATCVEFAQTLKRILDGHNFENENEIENEIIKRTTEIFPTLDELTEEPEENSDDAFSLVTYEYKNVAEYLTIQKEMLRADFMISLKSLVKELKKERALRSLQFASKILLINSVEIQLNDNFLSTRRHEMVFINTKVESQEHLGHYGEALLRSKINKLKSGTLICLTSTYEFNDLILAVVKHPNTIFTTKGYIAVEIVRQFNIGNIYNKDMIMFTSPAFFEPYHNVYNYLNALNIRDFPMKDFIVYGKPPENATPKYLSSNTIYFSGQDKFNPLKESPPIRLPLNASQRKAVQQALTHKFSLIQGPPGTGKTHVSAQLVKLLVENITPKPILVVAFTNESLDKFILKISTHTSSIARFGSHSRRTEISRYIVDDMTPSELINPRLKRLYYVVNTNFKAAFEELQKTQREFDGTDEGYKLILAKQQKVRILTEKLDTIRMLFKYYVVREKAIVAATTTCAAKLNFLFRLLGCQIVLFEEAAEIMESHILACLTPNIEHVIMIGDHMQLKPFTTDFQHSRSYEMNVSLFERLIRRNIIKPEVLLTQYRMRPVIAELLCPIFYDVLHNDDSVETYPLVRGMKENLFFMKHSYKEKKSWDDSSLQNKFEAFIIGELVTYLLSEGGYGDDDIVILSPYAKQVDNLKLQHPNLNVATVDSFQGLEANIVILSLVRSNSEGQIGFLKEKNRICVALSRARYGLYIIGDLDMLSCYCPTWYRIETKLRAFNLVGHEFPYTIPIDRHENRFPADYVEKDLDSNPQGHVDSDNSLSDIDK